MTLIGTLNQFKDEKSYPLTIKEQPLLLIHEQGEYYLLANKCGHFGVELNDALIKDNQIICAQHGISFSLKSGLVINRPYENCDPIQVFTLVEKGNSLYCPDFSKGSESK